MGRPSSIKRLPPQVRERLNAWIRDEAVTQAEAAERCNELLAELYPGHPPLSKSAVNRYDISMREVGAKIQHAREISDAWIARLGSQPAGQLGHLIVETVRTIAFEVAQQVARGEITAESLPGVLDQVNKLALAAQRLARSSAEEERRERQIREEERKRASEAAAEEAGKAASELGLSAETADAIRRQVLGVE
jgi:hypothetical protein